MKKIKNMLLSLTLLLLLPLLVNASTSKFEIKVNNLNTNAITGNFVIQNGKIKSITMMNGWENKTGLNNTFYFTNSQIMSGSYVVAIIEVEKTNDLVYQVEDLTYHYLKCEQDKYGSYFDNKGNKVDLTTYKKACNISSNANLKSLKLSSGTLSPSFSSTITSYNTIVPYNTTYVNLTGIPEDSKSILSGDVNCQLKVGNNTCKLTITAEDKTTKTYTINITREEHKNSSTSSKPYVVDTTLKNFEIVNATMEEQFNDSINNYNIHVNKNAQEIYFKFTMDGINYTTKPCQITQSTTKCGFTITTYDTSVKKTYNFYIIPEKSSTLTPTESEITKPNSESNKPSTDVNKPSTPNNTPDTDENESNNVIPSLPSTDNQNESIDNNENKPEEEKEKTISFKIISIVIISILIGAILCVIFTKSNHKRKFFK